jgi:hypothetical protein
MPDDLMDLASPCLYVDSGLLSTVTTINLSSRTPSSWCKGRAMIDSLNAAAPGKPSTGKQG